MAAKKSRSSSDKQLKDTIRTLEAKLQRAEAKAARWKARSKRSQVEVGTLKARNAKLDKKLTKAADAARRPAPAPEIEPVAPVVLSTPEPAAATDRSRSTPDANWTVAQLREEVRSQGLKGLSDKSKAELIAALT